MNNSSGRRINKIHSALDERVWIWVASRSKSPQTQRPNQEQQHSNIGSDGTTKVAVSNESSKACEINEALGWLKRIWAADISEGSNAMDGEILEVFSTITDPVQKRKAAYMIPIITHWWCWEMEMYGEPTEDEIKERIQVELNKHY